MSNQRKYKPDAAPDSLKIATGQKMQDSIGRMALNPGIDIYGHSLLINDDSISCETCQMEEEIPEILQMSSGFYEVLWKLYLFGKFKNTGCEITYERDDSTDTTDTNPLINRPDGTPIKDGGRVYWSTDTYTVTTENLSDDEKERLEQQVPASVKITHKSDN